MKIYINQANENWICDRIREDFIRECPDLISNSIKESDIIWLISPWLWGNIPLSILKSKIVVCTIHHVDPGKFDKNEFMLRDSYIDLYHVPNVHTHDYISQLIDPKKIKTISYWYRSDKWFPVDKKDLSLEIRLPKGSPLVIGSFQRDTEGHDLRSPKLSKGPDIFCDILGLLDPVPFVILAGWRRQYVISRLQDLNIPFAYLENISDDNLNQLYNFLDLYLVTSRHEGGPQSILECAASRTPILSTNVGIAKNVLPSRYICDTIKSFHNKIKSYLKFYDTEYNYKSVQEYNLANLKKEYIKLFFSAYEDFNRNS